MKKGGINWGEIDGDKLWKVMINKKNINKINKIHQIADKQKGFDPWFFWEEIIKLYQKI